MPDDDPKKIGEILDIVAEKLPSVMKTIRETFLSEEAGRDFGKAVGAFYKELVASGIPSEQAMEMAMEYVNTIKGALSQFNVNTGGPGRWQGWHSGKSGDE